jgi:hypothetical protein
LVKLLLFWKGFLGRPPPVSAYFAEENPIKRDGTAVRQLHALKEHQGPREKSLRLSDVKQMFRKMKEIVG